MSVDLIKLLAILAGFTVIIAATVLSLRQNITWQHVVLFCLGGVLAGIPNIQLQAGGEGVNVRMGTLADAVASTSTATVYQSEVLDELVRRMDQLEQVLRRTAAVTPSPAAPAGPGAAPAARPTLPQITLSAESRQRLEASRSLSENAARIADRLRTRPVNPNPQ